MRKFLAFVETLLAAPLLCAQPGKPLLIHHPSVNRTQIAFSFAGDIWSVSRRGGEAHRLTAGPGAKDYPYFSPDGKWIAFTGRYYGNGDVFVIPAEGGEPRRVTYWPGEDGVDGWSPDGKRILFTSMRTTATGSAEAVYCGV